MSEPDRIRIPTNGHGPALGDAGSEAGAADRPHEPADPTAGSELRIAFTPGQLAAGAGIIAGILLLLAGGRRRGSHHDDEPV